MDQPQPFFRVRISHLDIEPSLSGLCVGYEMGEWREEQLAKHLMEWLPEFSLTYSELEGVHPGNMVALMREAAKKVYKTEKFRNRGEFGELILHAAIRQCFGSLPAISKIYYKTARNDTVKGFDAVHVVEAESGRLELWLGEAKFYSDIGRAIRDVVEELNDHTERDYLRDEFILISGKIDTDWPHRAELERLLSPNTSLDEVFDVVRMPVLLTYDSDCIAEFDRVSDEYCQAFENEIQQIYDRFSDTALPANISIHLFLLPLKKKLELIAVLNEQLQGWQKI